MQFQGDWNQTVEEEKNQQQQQAACFFCFGVEVERLFGVDQLTPISFPFERTTNIFNISGHRRGSKMALWPTTDAQCGNVKYYRMKKSNEFDTLKKGISSFENVKDDLKIC